MKIATGSVYVVAGILELLGLWFTFADLRAVQRRLREYVGRPINVFVHDAIAISDTVAVGVVTGPEPTLEEKIAALEEWRAALPVQLDDRDQTLRTQLRSELTGEMSALRNSLNDRIAGLQEVVGKPDRFWWRGPLMLGLGVLLGLVGNLMALATTA